MTTLIKPGKATPVYEASRLQDDLIRAGITPAWWVINQSWRLLKTYDPILKSRAQAEAPWIVKITEELAPKCVLVGWQLNEPVGWENLFALSKS